MLTTKWLSYFFKIAEAAASMSRDPSTKVGAVIINSAHKTIVATGYNGFPRGVKDDPAQYLDRPVKLKYTVHAELNAIINAAANGAMLRGCALFVTLPPCMECAKAIIQAGIVRVYYYRDLRAPAGANTNTDPLCDWRDLCADAADMLEAAGVIVLPFDPA